VAVIIEPNGIANNGSGLIATGLWVPKINLNASASLYDFIKTHTVAGQGTPHAAPMLDGDFAIALETGTSPSAILFTVPYQGAGTVADITGTFAFTGDISPSQITSNQNDYNPTSLASSAVLRLNTDASRNITGLQGGADGRIIVIVNVGSFNIVLKDDDGSTSTAGNRFALSGDITIAPDDGVILQYDSTSSRWRCIGKSPGGASSGVEPWLVDIIPMISDPDATTGTWALLGMVNSDNITYPLVVAANPNSVGPVFLYNSSTAQNDAISWKVGLSAGTWNITIHCRKSTNTGIFTVNLDGASVGTVDSYGAAVAYGKISVTGFSVPTSGAHVVQLKMATKNASSSGYLGEIMAISLRRTS